MSQALYDDDDLLVRAELARSRLAAAGSDLLEHRRRLSARIGRYADVVADLATLVDELNLTRSRSSP